MQRRLSERGAEKGVEALGEGEDEPMAADVGAVFCRIRSDMCKIFLDQRVLSDSDDICIIQGVFFGGVIVQKSGDIGGVYTILGEQCGLIFILEWRITGINDGIFIV